MLNYTTSPNNSYNTSMAVWKIASSYSRSFSRTFWDSSSRSCRAFSLLESSSTVATSSHNCLLRSCRLRPEDVRDAAGLTPGPSQISWVSSSVVPECKTDSSSSRSCQRRERTVRVKLLEKWNQFWFDETIIMLFLKPWHHGHSVTTKPNARHKPGLNKEG